MIDSSSYDRVLKTALAEIEARIVAVVEREFEGLPLDVKTLPIIGGWPFLDYERVEQKQLAVAALRAKRWSEFEAPKWAQPLPLKDEDCVALFNRPYGEDYRANRRASLRGNYGLHARGMEWVIERLTPFEKFYAGPSRSW